MRNLSRRLALVSVTVFVLALSFAAPAAAASSATGPGASANYFGAIAVEPQTGASGWGSNYATKNGAKNRALSECRQVAHRPNRCQVFVWVKNGCAAVAYRNNSNGTTSYSWGIGQTRSQAKQRAKNELGSSARNLAWVCTQ